MALPTGLPEEPPPSLQLFRIAGVVLVVVDGFVLNQGFLSLFIGLWASFSLAMMVVHKPDNPWFVRQRGFILLAAALVVGVCNWGNNQLALSRADEVIQGVRLYQAKYGTYPVSLQEMTPEFLPAIPRAKWILFFGDFDYTRRGEEAYLAYMKFPPLGSATYLFSEKRWVP